MSFASQEEIDAFVERQNLLALLYSVWPTLGRSIGSPFWVVSRHICARRKAQ